MRGKARVWGLGYCLPAVPEGGSRFGVTVLVTVMFGTVLGIHFVKRRGREGVVGRKISWPWLAAGRGAVQAGSRFDSREPISGKASVSRAVSDAPLPAAVLAISKVLDVLWRRQGRRGNRLVCSRDGHGCGRAREWWSAVVWQ